MDKWPGRQNGGSIHWKTEYRKKKKVKRKEDSSGMTLNAHSQYRGSRGRREKGPKKICEDIIPEHFPNIGKEIVN